MSARTRLLSPQRVERTLTRLAYEIVERNRGTGQLVLIGIRTRGTALAQRIAAIIGTMEDRTFPVMALDTDPYRDDRELPRPPRDPDFPAVADAHVVLVDDVLYTGRTARAALEAVLYHGRPHVLQLAVLIDRGHREVPIQPDYVGAVFPTKAEERVVVDVADGLSVYLEE